MTNEEIEIIEKNIKDTAKKLNLSLTNNLPKIARAKAMMFGVKNWHKCPCDAQNPDRYCGSELCKSEAEISCCHCHLMYKE